MADNNVPIFPREAMIGSLADLAREAAKGNEVPEEFLFGAALTVFGAVASGRLFLQIGLDSDTRLYTVLVAESASGKKSTATAFITEFFKSLNLPDWNVCYGVGSAEGLGQQLNTTMRLLLNLDELRSFMEKSQIKGSVLLPMTATLFEKLHYENHTKDSHIAVEEARLGLLACSTVDTYNGDMWSAEAIAIGLPNRLFVVSAPQRPRVAWPKERNRERLDAIGQTIKGQFARLPEKLGITPEAKVVWEEWYENLPACEQARRLDTIGFRLMPILATTTDSPEVDVDIVEAVTAILDYELQIRTLLDPVDAETIVAKVEQKICRRLKVESPMSRRSLSKAIHAERYGKGTFGLALQNLQANGDIELFQLGLTGRKLAYRLSEPIE